MTIMNIFPLLSGRNARTHTPTMPLSVNHNDDGNGSTTTVTANRFRRVPNAQSRQMLGREMQDRKPRRSWRETSETGLVQAPRHLRLRIADADSIANIESVPLSFRL